MQIIEIKGPGFGTWTRDCILLSFEGGLSRIELMVDKDSTNSKWRVVFDNVVAYKVMQEEFSTTGILYDFPIEGGFFEVKDSSWIEELCKGSPDIIADKHHFVYFCYDEVLEVIAKDFTITEVKDEIVQEESSSAPNT